VGLVLVGREPRRIARAKNRDDPLSHCRRDMRGERIVAKDGVDARKNRAQHAQTFFGASNLPFAVRNRCFLIRRCDDDRRDPVLWKKPSSKPWKRSSGHRFVGNRPPA